MLEFYLNPLCFFGNRPFLLQPSLTLDSHILTRGTSQPSKRMVIPSRNNPIRYSKQKTETQNRPQLLEAPTEDEVVEVVLPADLPEFDG